MAFSTLNSLHNIQRFTNKKRIPTTYTYTSSLTSQTLSGYTVLTIDNSGTLTFTNPPPTINYFIVGGGRKRGSSTAGTNKKYGSSGFKGCVILYYYKE